MAEIYVSNHAELMSALSGASGGQTIVLKDGDYGSLDIVNMSFSGYVTIISENPLGAKFEDISLQNSSYVRIDGVHVDNSTNGGAASKLVDVSGSNHIQFVNSEVNGKVDSIYDGHYGLFSSNSSDILFSNNFVHNVKNGGVFFSTSGLEVSENTYDYIGEDSMKFAGVNDVLIENNTGARNYFPSPTAHSDFIQFQGSDSSNIIVRGNVSLPENYAGVQGIFFDGAHYTNVLIEQNIIVTGMIRGVSVSSGTNVVARYNTVLDIDGVGSKATKVMVDGESYGNIQGSYLQDASMGTNLTLQQADTSADLHYNDVFQNATVGLGITLEDLRPIEGGLGETYGAYARLMELLDGTTVTPAPAPQPEPETPSEPDATEPEPEDQPTDSNGSNSNDQDASIEGAVYSLLGSHYISNNSDVIEMAHSDKLALASGTIALTFNADSVSGRHGILSKDASHFVGGGHHFTSYIEKGTLHVRFQNADSSQSFKIDGISSGRDYDFQITFGDGEISVWLDGSQVGSAAFDMNWENNTQFMQIGANGWASENETSGFTHVFKGTISDVVIVEGVKTPDQMATILSGEGAEQTLKSEYPAIEDPVAEDPIIEEPVADEPATPQPETEVVFSLQGDMEFSGSKGDIVNLEHQAALELAEGTIAFRFEADTVNGKYGLISKDASYYEGGGNHFSAWIQKGELHVRFQDEDSDASFVVRGIEANKQYDVQAFFDDDEVGLLLDGELVGKENFTMDWTQNGQNLQVGGLGWASSDGGGDVLHAFDGTISDVEFYDQAFQQDLDFVA